MEIKPNGTQYIYRKKISQGIQGWLKVQQKGLHELALKMGCSVEYIKRIINCEPVKIELQFLQNLVAILNPTAYDYRLRFVEEIPEILSWNECVKLLELPSPHQGTLWDYEK